MRALPQARVIEQFGLVVAATLTAAVAGVSAASSPRGVLIALLATGGVVVAAAIARFGVGVWIALLALAGVDALPGPNLLKTTVFGVFTGVDVAILALIVTLLVVAALDAFMFLRTVRVGRMLAWWASIFMAYWCVTLARSWIAGVPPARAAHFGSDFAYFALLVPLLASALWRPRIRDACLVTLAAGALVTAITEIAAITTSASLSTIVHVTQVSQTNGLTRVYAPAEDLVAAAFMVSCGLFVLGGTTNTRRLGGAVALIAGADVALSLVRAQYVGALAGLGAASLVWLILGGTPARPARRRVRNAIALLSALVIAVIVLAPASAKSGALHGVSTRFSSIFDALGTGNAKASTVAFRAVEARELEQRLGSEWPLGLGFLDPRSRYYPSLEPSGSIRNSDVGILNPVMTMGVVGTALFYLPLLWLSAQLVTLQVTRRAPAATAWAAFGIFAWLVMASTTSVTLVILFSPTGAVVSAVMTGAGCALVQMARAAGGMTRH